MIWLRRFLAVLFGLLTVPLIIAALLLLHVNSTVLNPNFYIDQLRRGDAYTFAYDVVLPRAVDEAAKSAQALPFDVVPLAREAAATAKEVFPPAWLQERAESLIITVLPYVFGDTEGFVIVVPLRDRVEAAGPALKGFVRRSNLFNIGYDQVLQPTLDGFLARGDLPLPISVTSAEVVSTVKEVFPPVWLNARLDETVDALVPYLAGRQQSFVIVVPLKDRVDAAGPALKSFIRRNQVFDALYDQALPSAIDGFLQGGQLPIPVPVTGAELAADVKVVLPPSWLNDRLDQIVDTILPYVTGEQDGFLLVVPVADRVEALRDLVKDLLRRGDARGFLLDTVVGPLVAQNLGEQAQLPLGLSITSEELKGILTAAFTEEWVEGRLTDFVNVTADYLSGKTESLALTIPLDEPKVRAVPALADLVERKLREALGKLPECTLGQLAQLDLSKVEQEGLPCRPPGLDVEQFKALLGADFMKQMVATVVDQLPNSFAATAKDLRNLLGEDQMRVITDVRNVVINGFRFSENDLKMLLAQLNYGDHQPSWETLDDASKQLAVAASEYVARLEEVRGLIENGLAFTDRDLKMLLAQVAYDDRQPAWDTLDEAARERIVAETASVAQLEEARGWIKDGFTFTDQDLRSLLAEGEAAQDFASFDQARRVLGQVRAFAWLAWAVPGLLLLLIGLLGGRRLWSKVAWAAFFLAVPSAIVLVLAGPTYTIAARPVLQAALSEATAGATGLALVLTEKATSMALAASDDFFSGLATQALVLLLLSIAAPLFFAFLWPRMVPRRAPATVPPPSTRERPGS
ncbi:MAG: hypothetical protein HY685_04910 [Chloroflexi bacterium]|nr:hypothetical protein [Chloroflexota bacterium]